MTITVYWEYSDPVYPGGTVDETAVVLPSLPQSEGPVGPTSDSGLPRKTSRVPLTPVYGVRATKDQTEPRDRTDGPVREGGGHYSCSYSYLLPPPATDPHGRVAHPGG